MGVLDEGKKAWPKLEVSAAELDTFLSARTPGNPPPAADLYLVCACLLQRPGALAALETTVFAQIAGWVARVDPSPGFCDDVAQAVRELLLTGSPPRLSTYEGKGSLEGWVRVMAVRHALKQKAKAPPEKNEALSSGVAMAEPGAGLEKEQVKREIEAALEGALASLASEERAWLKLYYLDGLSLERVASLFGVHTSTISRRIAALEGQVQAAVRERLQQTLRVDRGEVESLIRFVRSQLEVSLSQALKKSTD